MRLLVSIKVAARLDDERYLIHSNRTPRTAKIAAAYEASQVAELSQCASTHRRRCGWPSDVCYIRCFMTMNSSRDK